MNDFAEALTIAAREDAARRANQLQDYGRLLAQAGVPLEESEHTGFHVMLGYTEQLRDFPNG